MWNFCFRVSAISYVVFFVADYVRPGFVSMVFTVHWLLIPLLISFVGVMMMGDTQKSMRIERMSASLFSVLLVFLVWKERLVFDDFFLLALVAGAMLPFLLRHALNKSVE